MPLTVLTDSEVRSMLHSLSRDDVVCLQHNLAEALHDYSTGTQETSGCCSANQPQRLSIKSKDQSTMFMPARTGSTVGVKVVTLATNTADVSLASSTSSLNKGLTSTSSSHGSSSTPSSRPSIVNAGSTTPRGSLTLLDPLGTPLAFINAEELTAFRTALASTILFSKRSRVHTVAIFGAGKQAYWHIRLALILRGEDIHQVNIINRTFSSAEPLMNRIYKSDEWEELRHSNPKLKFSVISAEFGEYTRILKEHVRRADAIFMCTPSLSPLFPAEHLTNSEGRKKGRYISLIGSYKPNMVELHPDVLRQAVAAEHRSHHHKHAERGGVIIVDSLESCLREAGEVIQAGLNSDQLVEIGELLMVKKAAMREVEMGGEGEKGLQSWLQGGNVIYKSVGLGIMDVCVGENLVVLARERGYGTTIEEF